MHEARETESNAGQPSRASTAGAILGFAAAYFSAGKFGLSLAFVNASASAVWPPTGIALAVLLLWGIRLWPGVLIGAFLVNVTTQGGVATSLGIATGNTLEAVVAAGAVGWFAGGVRVFERVQDIFKYVLLAAVLSTALCATVGVGSLCLGRVAPWNQFGPIWLTWWLGDLISDLTIAPLLLIWKTQEPFCWTPKQRLEAAGLLVTVLATCYLLFIGAHAPGRGRYPLEYLAVPPLLWAALRFEQRGAATCAALISGIALWGTRHGLGPFASSQPNEALLLLQTFMGTLALTALTVAALISERNRVEATARASDAQKAAVLETALDCIITMNQVGLITEANPATERTFGFSRAEMLGKGLAELMIPARFREAHRRGLAHYLATGEGPILRKRIELIALRKDGTEFPVELAVRPIQQNGSQLFTATLRDISKRRQAEEALAASRERLAAILESAMDAIITIDDQQHIVLFNPAAERMFGCAASDALNSPIDRFIPERFRQAHRGHVEHFGQTGQTPRAMGRLGALSGLRADGQEFRIEASISQVEVGQHHLFTVILRDITERLRGEEALQRARDELAAANTVLEVKVQERTAKLREMVAELEHFSYAIVHDIRAPLRAMQGFAALIEDELGDLKRPELMDYLERIRTSAGRLDNLVRDALTYNEAVRHHPRLDPVDLSWLLTELLKTYPDLQPPKAEIHLEGTLPVVLGNVSSLTQCFSNLLGNAVKFVGPGVTPRVRVWAELMQGEEGRASRVEWAEPQHQAPSLLSGSRHPTLDTRHPFVRIWVEDNGIGIPQEWQGRIFDMFQRVNPGYEGTGIGLAIVRKVTQRMEGRAGVESAPGKGSRFWVELRAVQ